MTLVDYLKLVDEMEDKARAIASIMGGHMSEVRDRCEERGEDVPAYINDLNNAQTNILGAAETLQYAKRHIAQSIATRLK